LQGIKIEKEIMVDAIKIKKSSHVEIKTREKGTNTETIQVKNQKDAYIEILSQEVSKDKFPKIRDKVQGWLIVILTIKVIVLFNEPTKDEINMKS
jgi:hypothetical protein